MPINTITTDKENSEDGDKLTAIRSRLSVGEYQLDRGEFVKGEEFIKELIAKHRLLF